VNKGFASARNKAMELAKGDWIAIIDHDDICLLDRLEIQSTHIRENPNAKLFFGNTIHFNDEGVEIRRQFDRINPDGLDWRAGQAMNNFLIHRCFMASSVVVFNKNTALSIGGFNTKYKYVVDADFFKIMGSRYDIYAGEETISKWRVHKNQATHKMKSIIHKEGNQTFIKYFFFERVNNKARLSMILYHVRRYLKIFLTPLLK
jgi:glycosyltransferase involved in cell wall biosynthesis